MFSFEWETPPDVWVKGLEAYEDETFHELFAICQKYAELIQADLRANAPWEDTCMPGREYLRAEAFYPDRWSVGVRIWYDLELYRQNCPEPEFDWGHRHEAITFKKKGVIAVIAPRGEVEGQMGRTALGNWADQFWDEIRAQYASSGADIIF